MPWPTIFANLAAGNQPLALFDAMFTQVAQMVAVPCTAAGTNALTLTPIGSAPSFTSYQNFTSARFVAGASTTGAVTAQFGALAALNVYLADGTTQASTGNIQSGHEYVLVFVQALNAGAGGFILETAAVPVFVGGFTPNVQVFLSGTSLTYTTPLSGGNLPLYIHVRMVGGGGGGAAQNTNNGSAGSDTSFASWTAIHGAGGVVSANGGAGGSGGVNGTGNLITRVSGSAGGGGNAGGGGGPPGGAGGGSFFGGAGASTTNAAGGAAATNSGSGGGGGNTGSGNSSGGGGAGEFVEFVITSPASSYTYTVGGGGNGGTAGGAAGGAGAAGRIEVIAYWQ
jgi:hypothetical protein